MKKVIFLSICLISTVLKASLEQELSTLNMRLEVLARALYTKPSGPVFDDPNIKAGYDSLRSSFNDFKDNIPPMERYLKKLSKKLQTKDEGEIILVLGNIEEGLMFISNGLCVILVNRLDNLTKDLIMAN